MIPPPPISTLFPYTTLFRSNRVVASHWFRFLEIHLDTLSRVEFMSRKHGPSFTKSRSEEHTSELQSLRHLVCRLLLEKKKKKKKNQIITKKRILTTKQNQNT